uniref:Uncharacterized protein n=1 Tax=Oreochromis niloticus TaxID=8128 RepID=A0A669D0A0_ORENI
MKFLQRSLMLHSVGLAASMGTITASWLLFQTTGDSTYPSLTGPFMFLMIEWLLSSMNSTRTCVHCPWEPVLPRTLVTLASLMGCTRLVSMSSA